MSINPVIRAILTRRGISAAEQAHFLHPDFVGDQHDASIMKGMPETVERLVAAQATGEKVIIFGDYDADGIPATALLTRVLGQFGFEVEPIIPTRAQGYGLTMPIVKSLITQPTKLIITVDNGTVSQGEVAALTAAGKEVLIIDHHEPQEGEMATTALAIINPKQAGCPYPFKELCACGLAWKVLQQLARALGENEARLKWELDLVALSTIADMVPLVGENRLFATFGLRVLRQTRNIGIQALADVSGITLAKLSAGDVGFKLAPRINAPSRMHQEKIDNQNVAVELLIQEDAKQAIELAGHLQVQNSARQQLLEEHLAQAFEQARLFQDAHAIVVYEEGWSSGLIGLVAGRLLELYRRPIIVLAREDGEIKGSVRSVEGVHAVKMLEAAQQVLSRYGGHSKAAGLTLAGDVETFRELITRYVADLSFSLEELRRMSERESDGELSLAEVTLDLCAALEDLEPFGVGFPRPIFQTVCQIKSSRLVGNKGQHLSCFLQDGDVTKKAIAFQLGNQMVVAGARYTVYFSVQKETWQGVDSPQCVITKIESA